MSATELDEQLEQILAEIEIKKPNLSEDEQNFVDAWIAKIKGIVEDDEKPLRNYYLNLLRSQITREDKHLSSPFLQMPPDTRLQDIQTSPGPSQARPQEKAFVPAVERRRYQCIPPEKKPPCRPKTFLSKIPERAKKSEKNDFEDPEEMAKCIVRSRGMRLAEFVADISRHTADRGHELRAAMKAETTAFKEYMEGIMKQWIKDLAELLDVRQSQELDKIQADYSQWQSELSFCKTQLKSMVPDFNLDSYRKDKNYLKKFFSFSSSNSTNENGLEEWREKEWREKNCVRIEWFVGEITKLKEENNNILEQIKEMEAKTVDLEQEELQKEKCHCKQIQRESGKYKKLQQKNNKLVDELANLLMPPENLL